MDSQPQNPKFGNNPKGFHPGMMVISEKVFLKKLHYLNVLTSCSYPRVVNLGTTTKLC